MTKVLQESMAYDFIYTAVQSLKDTLRVNIAVVNMLKCHIDKQYETAQRFS